MYLSVTNAAKAAGVSRTTLYEKINSGELSRAPEGIDTSELLRVFGELKKTGAQIHGAKKEEQGDDMTLWLRDRLDDTQRDLRQARAGLEIVTTDLIDTRERLHVHQEAARLLENKSKESEKLLEKISGLARQTEEELACETFAKVKALAKIKTIESRGLLARILNRMP